MWSCRDVTLDSLMESASKPGFCYTFPLRLECHRSYRDLIKQNVVFSGRLIMAFA